MRAHPFGDVEHAESHVPALVARDQGEHVAQQRVAGVPADALEDVHRHALEEELLGGDELQRRIGGEQGVEHHLRAEIDVLGLLVHLLHEAAVRQVMTRFIHRLRRGVIAVVFLAHDQADLGADVLRDALPDLQDVEHAAEPAARGVVLHLVGQGLKGRRAPNAVRRRRRFAALDRSSIDVAVDVPTRRVCLREQRIDALVPGVLQLHQLTRAH
jgi:hypothetical protein